MTEIGKREVMEKYLVDLKALFLKRFGYLNTVNPISDNEERRLIELLREIIFVSSRLYDFEDDS